MLALPVKITFYLQNGNGCFPPQSISPRMEYGTKTDFLRRATGSNLKL